MSAFFVLKIKETRDEQYIGFDEVVVLIVQHANRLVRMRNDKNNITIAYTGSAVGDGIMDVSISGPALMALGTLVNWTNKALNHDNSRVAAKVNADFQKDSFKTQLDIIRTIIEQLQNLFNNYTSVGDMLSVFVLDDSKHCRDTVCN